MFTEAQAKALTICDACSDERVFSPADAVVRAGSEYAGYNDVHLCHACGDSEPWTRATKREIKQPAERHAWALASMEERRAALAGHFEWLPSERDAVSQRNFERDEWDAARQAFPLPADMAAPRPKPVVHVCQRRTTRESTTIAVHSEEVSPGEIVTWWERREDGDDREAVYALTAPIAGPASTPMRGPRYTDRSWRDADTRRALIVECRATSFEGYSAKCRERGIAP